MTTSFWENGGQHFFNNSKDCFDIMNEDGACGFAEPASITTCGNHESSGRIDENLGYLSSMMTRDDFELRSLGPGVIVIVDVPQPNIVV